MLMRAYFSFIILLTLLFPTANALNAKEIDCDNTLNAAVIFKETMEYDKAIEVLESASCEKLSSESIKLLAKLYYLTGEPDKALDLFNEITDDDWWVYVYKGLIYEDRGKKNLAIKNYLRSIQSNKNNIAYYRIAKLYYKDKNYEKAKQYFLKLIRFDPSERMAYYYVGDCLIRQNQYQQAYSYLSKAIQFYPDNPKVKELIKLTKEKLGKKYFEAKEMELAKQRRSRILRSYKRDDTSPPIRVGLATGLSQIVFRCGADFTFSDGTKDYIGRKDIFYKVTQKGDKFLIIDADSGKKQYEIEAPLEIRSLRWPFQILDLTYGKEDYWQKTLDRIYRGDLRLLIRDGAITLVNVLSITDYLYGVVPAEIFYYAPSQALNAQAVAARTIAFNNMGRFESDGFDICADVNCQVYQGMSVEKEQTNDAVVSTRGEVLYYDNKPIEAFYHANCGGCLRSEAFGQREYLATKFDSKTQPSPLSAYDEEIWFFSYPETFSAAGNKSKFRWQRVYDLEDYSFAFDGDLSEIDLLLPLKKGDCFHYEQIDIVNPSGRTTLKGGLKIRKYFGGLRSSSFKIEAKLNNDKPSMLFFWGAGFGHGAGLSQEGAIEMANQGYTYKDILKHYYPSSKLKKLY